MKRIEIGKKSDCSRRKEQDVEIIDAGPKPLQKKTPLITFPTTTMISEGPTNRHPRILRP